MLDSISDDERVKAQACIARILRAVGDKVTGEYIWDTLHQDFIDALGERIVSDAAAAGARDAIAINEGAWSSDLAQQKRKASLLAACHLASTNFVVECLKFIDISAIARLCATDDQGEILGCEALAACASSESGRLVVSSLSTSWGIRKVDAGRPDDERSSSVGGVAVCQVGSGGQGAQGWKS